MRHRRIITSALSLDVGAFTLVELLVVVSLITLLIGMLLPGLGKSRKAARAIECLSNQRQLQQAQINYSDSNAGRTKNLSHGFGNYWHHSLASYLGDDKYRTNSNLGQWRFAPMSVLACPEARQDPVSAPGNIDHLWSWGGGGQGAYGANLWMYPKYAEYDADFRFPDGDFFASFHDVPSPSATPLYGDSNWVGGWPDDVDFPPPNPATGPPPNLYTGLFVHEIGYFMGRWTIDRHDSGINVVLVDGSARKVTLEGLWQLRWHKSFQPRVVTVP